MLKAFLSGHMEREDQKSKIGSAPAIPADTGEVNGIDIIFVLPSMDGRQRLAQFEIWMGTWLREELLNGTIKPSPQLKVVGQGLESINTGLDLLLKGVSCTKLVIEIAK